MRDEDTFGGRRLILLRHAKSAWPEGVADHDRPLAARGEGDAPRMGSFMATSGLFPDLVLVSSALRAQQTWQFAKAAFERPPPERTVDEIYEATADELVDLIRSAPPETVTLAVVGHNPGLEDLALKLLKGDGGEAGARLRTKFPTAGLAVFEFGDIAWSDLAAGCGMLAGFVTPRMLREP